MHQREVVRQGVLLKVTVTKDIVSKDIVIICEKLTGMQGPLDLDQLLVPASATLVFYHITPPHYWLSFTAAGIAYCHCSPVLQALVLKKIWLDRGEEGQLLWDPF